jgi:HD-like signal output (HDOD) protein
MSFRSVHNFWRHSISDRFEFAAMTLSMWMNCHFVRLSRFHSDSMSSSSRQRSVSVVQMFNNQTSNVFDVLRNRSSTRAFQKITQNTQTQTSIQSQTVFKSRERSFNSRKTIESKQNDDELWRHDSFLQFYSTMWKMKRKTRWCRF